MADEELKGHIIKLEVELLEAQRNVKVRDAELTAKTKQLGDNERDTLALRALQQQQLGQGEILRKEIATLSGDNQKLAQRVAELSADRVRPTPTQLIQSFRTAMTDLQSSLAPKLGERVGYTVSQFDVDLKALISVDKADQSVRFNLPEVGETLSSDKLSTVRFTFQSVPKTEIPDASLVEVPTVAGTSIGTATVVLKSKGLGVGKVIQQDSGYAEGTVLNQSPDGGDLVPQGSAVDLVVARKPMVTVPKLEGLARDAAAKALQNVGLQVGVVTEKAAEGPVGVVLSQSVEPGVEVASNSAVDFVVSAHRVIKVPNIVGLSRDEAVKMLRDRQLSVGSIQMLVSSGPEGIVLTQVPASGATVEPGTAVNLVVSTQKTAVVPNLVEQPLDKATKLLERAGFALGAVREIKHATLNNMVLEQAPAAGTEVVVGGAVDVVVAYLRDINDVIKQMNSHRDFGKTGLKANALGQRLADANVTTLADLSKLAVLSEAQLRTKLNIRSVVGTQIFKKVLQSVLG